VKDINEIERLVKTYYPCATLEQYAEWKSAARLCRPAFPGWFCTDCTPQYQRRMKEENKCVRPEIKFRITGSEGIEGFIPTKHNRTGELF